MPIQFTLADNDAYELTNTLTLSLTLMSPDFGAALGDRFVEITLQDDDSKASYDVVLLCVIAV